MQMGQVLYIVHSMVLVIVLYPLRQFLKYTADLVYYVSFANVSIVNAGDIHCQVFYLEVLLYSIIDKFLYLLYPLYV